MELFEFWKESELLKLLKRYDSFIKSAGTLITFPVQHLLL
jgi:hypothetical protein